MKKVINIEGMSCMHCSARVEDALNKLTGVTAKVDLDNKLADVEASEDTDDAVLKKAVEDAGYQVVSIK